MNDTITFIDIDETLFFTKAKIRVINSETGTLVRSLTNQEYNNYEHNDNETLNFDEFVSADIFVNTSKPIPTMIAKIQELFEKAEEGNSEVYLLTARQDFDDKDKFLDFLIHHGINVGHKDDGKIHVLRAGNMPGLDNAGKKKTIIKNFLTSNRNIKTVRLYDDAVSNLKAFKELAAEFPKVNIEAFIIKHLDILAFN